mgnify:FL=1
MTEFLEIYGVDITAMIIALSGAITAVVTMIKSFKANNNFRKDVEITQDGIKEGFKIFADKKLEVSLGEKFDKKLDEFKNETVKDIKNTLFELRKDEEKRVKLQYYNAKILSNTRAFDKLEDYEQKEFIEIVKSLDKREDNTEIIEIQGE